MPHISISLQLRDGRCYTNTSSGLLDCWVELLKEIVVFDTEYANDVFLLCDNAQTIQRKLRRLVTKASWCGICFATSKYKLSVQVWDSSDSCTFTGISTEAFLKMGKTMEFRHNYEIFLEYQIVEYKIWCSVISSIPLFWNGTWERHSISGTLGYPKTGFSWGDFVLLAQEIASKLGWKRAVTNSARCSLLLPH